MTHPNLYPGADSPSGVVRSVTKSDSADLPGGIPRSLNIGTAGTLNFIDSSGYEVTNFPAQVGYNPISPKRIKAGGTADNIWALY
jgi:hypothetical protein